jgi:hypothetical protein
MKISILKLFFYKVYAAGAGNIPGGKFPQTSVQELVGKILDWVFGVAGAIFVIMIIVGGLQYLTAAGNEEASGKAKKIITYAVIGIAITVGAWAISEFILTGIGVTDMQWFNIQ